MIYVKAKVKVMLRLRSETDISSVSPVLVRNVTDRLSNATKLEWKIKL